jgi:hypothetical protein
MVRTRQSLCIALVAYFAAHAPVRSADDTRPRVSKEYLTIVKVETRYLVRAVERFQETIIEELNGRKERKIYRQADDVLSLLVDFERGLDAAPSRERLYARFGEVGVKLHELLEAVQKEAKDVRALRREASRVDAADEELHFALSAGDTTALRVQQVFKRQARRLVFAAKELEETAQYALSQEPGDVSPGDFRKLVEASVRFQRSVEAGTEREQLRKDFQDVDQAWLRVVEVLKRIKPRQNLYLVRCAAQVDRLHERLYRLLDLKEKDRPRLIIST